MRVIMFSHYFYSGLIFNMTHGAAQRVNTLAVSSPAMRELKNYKRARRSPSEPRRISGALMLITEVAHLPHDHVHGLALGTPSPRCCLGDRGGGIGRSTDGGRGVQEHLALPVEVDG